MQLLLVYLKVLLTSWIGELLAWCGVALAAVHVQLAYQTDAPGLIAQVIIGLIVAGAHFIATHLKSTPHFTTPTNITPTASNGAAKGLPLVAFFSAFCFSFSLIGCAAIQSPIGQSVTQFVATVAGSGSATAIIQHSSNKQGTANDIDQIASAAYTVLSGDAPPSQQSIYNIFIAFKSNAATSAYESEANTAATDLYNFLNQYQGTPWINVATWYVYGWQLAAQLQGGVAAADSYELNPVARDNNGLLVYSF